MDHQPFLDAIRREPDSQGPRLVYADWLDERGDPRAELIRIQCALQRLSIRDPEWPTLDRRERELLSRLGGPYLGAGFVNGHFQTCKSIDHGWSLGGSSLYGWVEGKVGFWGACSVTA